MLSGPADLLFFNLGIRSLFQLQPWLEAHNYVKFLVLEVALGRPIEELLKVLYDLLRCFSFVVSNRQP